jgi:hypothetical protein
LGEKMSIFEKIFKYNSLAKNEGLKQEEIPKKIGIDLNFIFLNYDKAIELRDGDDGFYMLNFNLYLPPYIKNEKETDEFGGSDLAHKELTFDTSFKYVKSSGYYSVTIKLFGLGIGFSFQDGNY